MSTRTESEHSSMPEVNEMHMLNSLWDAIRVIQRLLPFQVPGPHTDHLRNIESMAEQLTVLFVATRLELLAALDALDGTPSDVQAYLWAWVAFRNMHEVARTLHQTVDTLQELSVIATEISRRFSSV
ncbi:hypothetical protein GYMLUDRAFT_251037 [Collybiopsis luxurians FD-317 M1]|uniref:Uncharacterized protein n=1 Tax=Collybiopsis luxurians FD-317 M1 TaxID=944289 RepID=A0A0D0BDP4_9AGAR|nr:hypothetical protein GYMLUDRAFT_251037 [Collybiopsis luxurians FD-317 M1]